MNSRSKLIALSLCTLAFTSVLAVDVAGKGKNVTVDKKDQNATVASKGKDVKIVHAGK